MRVKQLRDYLDALLDAGVPGDMPVCVQGDTALCAVTEADRAVLASGVYMADAAPGYAGLVPAEGEVLVLVSGAGGIECLTAGHCLCLPPVSAPEKSWPSGSWRGGR